MDFKNHQQTGLCAIKSGPALVAGPLAPWSPLEAIGPPYRPSVPLTGGPHCRSQPGLRDVDSRARGESLWPAQFLSSEALGHCGQEGFVQSLTLLNSGPFSHRESKETHSGTLVRVKWFESLWPKFFPLKFFGRLGPKAR